MSLIKYILPYGLFIAFKTVYEECREFLLKSRGNWFIPQKKFNECIVIANGPSLAKYKDEIIQLSKKCDVITLNFSIVDDIFFETNSFMHVIADPLFFDFPDNDEIYHSYTQFYNIINSIDRKLILAVPHIYYQTVRNKVKNNNITLLSFSDRQISSYNIINKYRMLTGVCGFGAQTVTIVSLYLALMIQYKKIWVIGFDLSDICYVDKYCRIFSNLQHFDKVTRIINSDYYYHKYYLRATLKVHEALLKVKKYAEKNNIEIINLSEESNIDIFKKGNAKGDVFPYKPKEKQPEDE
jgi:hypothetical protein